MQTAPAPPAIQEPQEPFSPAPFVPPTAPIFPPNMQPMSMTIPQQTNAPADQSLNPSHSFISNPVYNHQMLPVGQPTMDESASFFGGSDAWIGSGIMPPRNNTFSGEIPLNPFGGDYEDDEDNEQLAGETTIEDDYGTDENPDTTLRGPINLPASYYSSNLLHNIQRDPNTLAPQLSLGGRSVFLDDHGGSGTAPSLVPSVQPQSAIPSQPISQFSLAATAVAQQASSMQISAEELHRRLTAPTFTVSRKLQ